jgi:DNA polymerase I
MEKNTDRKKVILLDMHAIIHRAYHGVPNFTTKDGRPTGALYGVISMLLKIIEEFSPYAVYACYDLPEKTFRHIAYDEYKGTRSKTDDALKIQIQESRDIIRALSIPIYDAPGFEADDVIGTLAEQLKKEKNIQIIIASGDMDTMQLVEEDTVCVFTLKKGITDTIFYTETEVVSRFGFLPKYIADYKALRGDTSDNIIGIKGIGEKTATEIIKKWGNIENLYNEFEKNPHTLKDAGFSPRINDLVREGKDEAVFSKILATIRLDVPLNVVLPEVPFKDMYNSEVLVDLCRTYEFRSLIPRVQHLFSEKISAREKKDAMAEERLMVKHGTQDAEILNVDTTSILFKESSIMTTILWSDCTDPSIEIILQKTGSDSLEKAHETLLQKILKDEAAKFVYFEIEKPLIPVLVHMQEKGVLIDSGYLENLKTELLEKIQKLEKEIHGIAQVTFNLNSPKQLGDVLFDTLKLSIPGKKNQKRSTSVEVLEALEDQHPIIKKVLEYREVQKIYSTYTQTLLDYIGTDGRIHARFIQNGASTGRFSSADPNLQNLPIKSEIGRRIRGAFVAPIGSTIISCDYSQVELRVAAILSGDTAMAEIFQNGEDIHTRVAAYIYSVSESEVTKEMRRDAKVVNFGVLYGMGVSALQKELKKTRREAEVFSERYFTLFKDVSLYLTEVKVFAKEQGYTQTLFGRRRLFPEFSSPIPYVRALAERMAINAPIQGTAADIMKIAMRDIFLELKERNLLECISFSAQVHDELIFEVKDDYVEIAKEIITRCMESVLNSSKIKTPIQVPLLVSCVQGKSWYEAK